MAAGFTVKLVSVPDALTLKGIITIYRAQGWWKPGDTPALLRRMIRGSHCFAVAISGGKVIGIGRAISDGTSDAYIQDMAVLERNRKNGVGGAILRALMRRLRADGIKWTALIAQDNSGYFYRKAGFRPLKGAQPMLGPGTHV